MTRIEIQALIEELENKKANSEELKNFELCILDMAHKAKKKGLELTSGDISYTKFMKG